MDQLIFEKRAISSKKYTYLQYSVASALSKSSFFCITTIQDAIELYPDPCKSGKTKCARFEKRNVQKSGKTKRSKNFAHTTL